MGTDGFTYAWKDRYWWIGDRHFPSFFIGSACEVVATEIGNVTVCPGWNGDDPYVFARIPIPDLPSKLVQTGGGGRVVKATHGSLAALPWNGDRDGLLVMAGESPTQFYPSRSSNDVWQAAVESIRSHVVDAMVAWRTAHPGAAVQARIDQIEIQIERIRTSMKEWRRRTPEEIAACRRTVAEIKPKLDLLWPRVWAVGVLSPAVRWPGGLDDVTVDSSRGPVQLSLRQNRRLTMLVAVEDAGLRMALTSLMEQWWVHWSEALGPVLGWLEVGETLEAGTRPTTRDRRIIVPTGLERYPPEYPGDPEAERIFRELEPRMLMAAYRMLLRPYTRARKELEEVAWNQTRRDQRLAELNAEIARLQGTASPEGARPQSPNGAG